MNKSVKIGIVIAVVLVSFMIYRNMKKPKSGLTPSNEVLTVEKVEVEIMGNIKKMFDEYNSMKARNPEESAIKEKYWKALTEQVSNSNSKISSLGYKIVFDNPTYSYKLQKI